MKNTLVHDCETIVNAKVKLKLRGAMFIFVTVFNITSRIKLYAKIPTSNSSRII